MESIPRTRILLVDDEPNVLEGLQRILRRHFEVTTAVGGAEALAKLEALPPFAIIMSDLRMPGMDGVALLSRVRQLAPDTVRVLLTGQADLESAIEAVNQGAVFRFLTKPSTPEMLVQALSAAEVQHQLITAERVLLEKTLQGSIRALTDTMALVNPAAFGRAMRAKQQVERIATYMGLTSHWQLEVASMLSQIGSVTLPVATVNKLYQGDPLTHAESLAVEQLPKIASELVANIPRMEVVGEILAYQGHRFDGAGAATGAPRGKELPFGARLLKLVLDLDMLETQGMSTAVAVDALRSRKGWYDPDLLEVFAEVLSEDREHRVREMELRAARPGMILAEDVRSPTGMLLIARGQEVTNRLVERIHNLLPAAIGKQRVHMILSSTPRPEADPAEAEAPPEALY